MGQARAWSIAVSSSRWLTPATAVLVVLLAMTAPLRVARACGNAVRLSANARIIDMREAESALDEGDLLRARELASEVHRATSDDAMFERGPRDDRLADRAIRIEALSYVRDRDATDDDRQRAALALATQRAARTDSDPVLDAAYGEALAQLSERHAEAYGLLAPLAQKDLLGSPNALGALVVLAREQGDHATADVAKARCEGMIGPGAICRGERPRPPLVRGATRSYLPALLVALGALGFRLLRGRRARRDVRGPADDLARTPWHGHAASLQALALLGAGFYVFARPYSPELTTTVLAAVFLFTLVVERRSFFAAVRRGKIPGLVLRPAVPEDAHLRGIVLFGAVADARTLDRVHPEGGQPGYREPARAPLLRVTTRPLTRRGMALGAAGLAVLGVMAVLVALSLLFMRSG